jgi:phosphoribosylformylglycinamidine synthase
MLIDLGQGQQPHGRLASWRRCWARSATRCPIWTIAQTAEGAGRRRQRAARAGQLLAYHDRSDGGLWATVCEMAFAGHVGVALNVDMLVTEGDGITDSRAE